MEITQNTQCLNFETFFRSNQDTCLSQRPLISQGQWVGKGQLLADCINSVKGDLALGKNVLVAYMPWEGYNFEDSIVISDRLIADDVYTSIHVLRFKTEVVNNLSTSNSKFNLDFSAPRYAPTFGRTAQHNKLARKPSLLGNMFSYSALRIAGSMNKLRSIWCSASLCCVPHSLSSEAKSSSLKRNYLATKEISKSFAYLTYLRTSKARFATLHTQRLTNFLRSEKHDDNLLFFSNLYVPKIQRYEFYPKFANLVAINIFRFNYIKQKNTRKLLLRTALRAKLVLGCDRRLASDLRSKLVLNAKQPWKLDLPRDRLSPTCYQAMHLRRPSIVSEDRLSQHTKRTKLDVLKNQTTKPFVIDGLLQQFCLLTPWLCQGKLLPQKSKSKTNLNSQMLISKTKSGLPYHQSGSLSAYRTSEAPLVLDATFASAKFHLGDVKLTSGQTYLTKGAVKLASPSGKEALASAYRTEGNPTTAYRTARLGVLRNQEARFGLRPLSSVVRRLGRLDIQKARQVNVKLPLKVSATTSFARSTQRNVILLSKQNKPLSDADLRSQDVPSRFVSPKTGTQSNKGQVIYPSMRAKLDLKSCDRRSASSFARSRSAKGLRATTSFARSLPSVVAQISKNTSTSKRSNVAKISKTQRRLNESRHANNVETRTPDIPFLGKHLLSHLDQDGIAKVGTWVSPGDILVGKVRPLANKLKSNRASTQLAWEIISSKKNESINVEDKSFRLPKGVSGRVIRTEILPTANNSTQNVLTGGASNNEQIHIYLAVKRKVQVGDKLAGRHGNKGIVSLILPRQDMPYLADGTPIDIILSPLGVPSRMNVGQIYECLLGLAAKSLACNFKVNSSMATLGFRDSKLLPSIITTAYRTTSEARLGVPRNQEAGGLVSKKFDSSAIGARPKVSNRFKSKIKFKQNKPPCCAISYSNLEARNLVFLKLYHSKITCNKKWLFSLNNPGKMKIFDGRTGQPFSNWVTVGYAYMLKLIHLVDNKIHSRSTGPYSLITRQPVTGKARQGGQRIGEMEAWALEGFGAAYTLQEFFSFKGDDVSARHQWQINSLSKLVGNTTAFKTFLSELRALCISLEFTGFTEG